MDKFIQNLVSLSNNKYYYDVQYIKNKYNVLNIQDYDDYYNKNKNSILVFNSFNSEMLFMHCFNFNNHFIELKYSKDIYALLYAFFMNNEKYYFNECHEHNDIAMTHNISCSCPIKVKSIVKLKISALVHIYKLNPNFQNFNFEITEKIAQQKFKNSIYKIKFLKHQLENINTIEIKETINPKIIEPLEKNILLETFTNYDTPNFNYNEITGPKNELSTTNKAIEIRNVQPIDDVQNNSSSSENSNTEESNTEESKSEKPILEKPKFIVKKIELPDNKNNTNEELLKQKENNIKKMLMLLKK